MEKLDRLVWAAGMAIRFHGTRIGFRVTRPEGLALIRDALPPGYTCATSPVVDCLYSLIVGGPSTRPGLRTFHVLYSQEVRIARTLDPGQVMQVLRQDLPEALMFLSARRLMLGAAAVAFGGRALLLPGRRGVGKSTLVQELLRAGATLLSDTHGVLDGRGRVHPLAPQLRLHDADVTTPKRLVLAEELGSRMAPRAVPAGLILLTRYRPGARFAPRLLTPARAMQRLLGHTLSLRGRPDYSLAQLWSLIARVPVLEGDRGEASHATEWLIRELARLSQRRPHGMVSDP